MGFSLNSGGGGGGGGPLDNLAATSDPIVTNDADGGYSVGSHWVNTSNNKTFVCVDNTNGAAVWNQVDSLPISGPLDKLNATTDPLVTDDAAAGYSVGSTWVNVAADKTFICVDTTNGAAVWNQVDALGVSVPKTNYTATSDPLATNDDSEGYEAGSEWINITTDTLFHCVDPSTGIAVWDEPQIVGAAAVVDGWRVDNARYNGVSFDLTGQTGQMSDVTFSRDGTKMYIIDVQTTNVILQYNLSTPFDISTAAYASLSYAATVTSNATGIYFKDDGTKMYLCDITDDEVYQFTLSTPWKIDTASYDSVSFDTSSESISPQGIFIGDSGTKMYLLDSAAPDSVYQYTLATPWDLSTATYASKSVSITAQDADPSGIVLRDDGSKLFFVGTVNDSIYAYSLSVPWDISTATYDGDSFSFTSLESNVQGMAVNDDGKIMYVVGNVSDEVHEILTSSTDNLTGETWVDGKPIWRTIKTVADTGVGGTETISLGSTVDSLVDIGGYVIRDSDSAKLPLPYVDKAANLNIEVSVNSAGTDVTVASGSSQNHNGGTLWLEYTK